MSSKTDEELFADISSLNHLTIMLYARAQFETQVNKKASTSFLCIYESSKISIFYSAFDRQNIETSEYTNSVVYFAVIFLSLHISMQR